jgi:enolase
MPTISDFHARETLDSCGNPTLEIDVTLASRAGGGAHEGLGAPRRRRHALARQGCPHGRASYEDELAPMEFARTVWLAR